MDAIYGLLLILLAILLWRKSTSSRAVAAAIGLAVFLTLCRFIAYFVFDTLTGSSIDTLIVYHLTRGLEGAPTGDFTLLGLAAGTMLVITVFLSVYAYRPAKTEVSTYPRRLRSPLAVGLTSAAVYLSSATGDIATIVHAGQTLPATKAETGDLPDQFASIERLTFGTSRENFVLLYLESLERSYFDEQVFPDLMPNLIALEKDALSFSDITEVPEAGWTIAAMVASQCGIPLTVEGAGVDGFLPGVSCLGDLLDDAGYNLAYLGGADLNFAGKGAFYRSHGFDQIKGREELKGSLDDPEYLSAWGLFDDSLFDEAMQHFDRLAAADEPFGLVLLTVDTHHPFGDMSRTCGGDVYQDGGNEFLNAVHCADKMAADFIRHILDGPFSQDTLLVVMSDHMAMPNMAWDLLQETERRNLLLFFGPNVKAGFNPNPGTTFDVAPTLLGLLGADKRSLGYGRDLLGSEPTLRGDDIPLESILDEGRGYLASMWHFPEMSKGMQLDQQNDRLALGEQHLNLPALLLLNDELAITSLHFDIDSEIRLIERILHLSEDQRFIWVDSCEATAVLANATSTDPDQYCIVIGTLGSADLESITLADSRHVNFQEIAERFAAHSTSDVHYNRRLADAGRKSQFAADRVIEFAPKGMVGDIAVRSAGYSAGDSWVLNRDAGKRVTLSRGLTLLGLNADEPPVKIGHKDTCSYGGEKFDSVRLESDLHTAIDHNKELYGAFVIVAHNSMVCYEIDPNLELLFSNSPFEAWRDLWYEQPYVAVISGNGQVQEFVGERQTAMGVELRDFIEPRKKVTQRALRWLPRVAHAGGGYNGLSYTNSLNALDANADDYELFEIDLSWTSDWQMVCLHDWEQPFLAPSGIIKGEPLSLVVFEAIARQHADFQPCTLDSLTVWLRDHPDVRIIVDVKSNAVEAYSHIAEMHPDLQGRFIPQIYHPETYHQIRSLGFDDVIWTLDRYQGDIQDVLNWVSKMDLMGLRMAPEWVDKGLAAMAREQTGVLSWAHTLNSRADLDKVVQAGAAEIYTDFLPPGELSRFELVSASFGAGISRVTSMETGGEIKLARGVNLVGLSKGKDPEVLALFDGCSALDTGETPDPAPFRTKFRRSAKSYDALAVIVHDSAVCENVTLDPVLSLTGLTQWNEVGHRNPYIGLIMGEQRVLEFNGSDTSPLIEVMSIETRQR